MGCIRNRLMRKGSMKIPIIAVLILLSSICMAQVPEKAGTPHSVSLSCIPSTSSVSTGCNFYRGTVAGNELPTPLNASPALNYVDSSVVAFQTYFYVAKAYCLVCTPNLSVKSNEVTAIIPGDPQPLPPVVSSPTVK